MVVVVSVSVAVVATVVVISNRPADVFLTVNPASVAVVGVNVSSSSGPTCSVAFVVVLNSIVSVVVARSGFATVAVAVSVECKVMRDHAPSPAVLTARTCASYSVLRVSLPMVYSRAPLVQAFCTTGSQSVTPVSR